MKAAGHQALAWLAWPGGEDVRRAEATAVEWTERRCVAEGAAGVLYAESGIDAAEGPLAWFSSRYQVTTPSAGLRGASSGPVLACRPTLSWLPLAIAASRGSSLCVLEGPEASLAGWAMAAGAVDLGTGGVTVDTRTKEQRSIHALLLYAGGAQWGDDYGRAAGLAQVRYLAKTGMPLETTLGVMLAHGATARGLDNIRAIAAR